VAASRLGFSVAGRMVLPLGVPPRYLWAINSAAGGDPCATSIAPAERGDPAAGVGYVPTASDLCSGTRYRAVVKSGGAWSSVLDSGDSGLSAASFLL
jgi:hypothetical protein